MTRRTLISVSLHPRDAARSTRSE